MHSTIKVVTILIVTTIFSILISCSKNSSSVAQINPTINSEPQIDPTGNYQGTLTTYVDGKFLQSVNNAQVSIGSTTTKGQYSIITSLFVTLKANISSGNISIPKTVSTTPGNINVTEYGNGKIIGNNLTFDINQEFVANSSISTNLRFTFTGTKK